MNQLLSNAGLRSVVVSIALLSASIVAFATAHKGVFFLADTGNNRVLKIDADGLSVGSLYASVSSLSALVTVDRKTGIVTPLVGNLKAPHGLQFVARTEEDEDSQDD